MPSRKNSQSRGYYYHPLSGPQIVIDLLRFVRASAHTQEAIEKAAGVSNKALSMWANAKFTRRPRLDNLIAVGQVLGYELVWRKIDADRPTD